MAPFEAGVRLISLVLKKPVKLISPDRAFIYYLRDRPDGKSEGIRFSRAFGATGFINCTSAANTSHPVPFDQSDPRPTTFPVGDQYLPALIANCLAEIDPEATQLLSGEIGFEEALNEITNAPAKLPLPPKQYTVFGRIAIEYDINGSGA